MKKCYLDSNILIYFKDSTSIKHKETVNKLEMLISKDVDLYISSLVLDEFLYVFHYALLKKKIPQIYHELKKAMVGLFKIPQLYIINPNVDFNKQLEVIGYMQKYNLKPRDAFHLHIMLSNKIDGFLTFDHDFNKVFSSGIIKQA
jgi:predicted nucleic acid-binding protein